MTLSITDSSRFDILYELAYQFSSHVDSISFIYSTKAYDLALKLGDTVRIIKAGRIKSGQLRRLERYDKSIELAEQILSIAKRHKTIREVNFLLTSLANSHMLKAEYDLDRLLINMGLCYNSLGEYRKAKEFVEAGLNACGGQCSDEITMEGEIALGVSLLESGEADESIEHFVKSYEVAKQIKNYRFQAENLISLAKVHLKMKTFDKAKNYLTEAEAIAHERGYRFLMETTYRLFSELYERTGNYQSQSIYQSKYIKLRDSILNEKVISNLSQIRTEFQERENIKTIAEKDQVLTLQKEVITRQQRQVFFISIIACLIGALAYMLFYFNKRQQKSNQEISEAKNKIEEQNQQLASHNRQLEVEVDRRTNDLALSNKALQKLNDELDYFIYKSSHDIRGPLLTLKGMCNIAMMDLKDPVAVDYFRKFDITTDKLNVILTRLQIVNYISHSPLKPQQINFKSMIEDIIEFEKKKGVPDNLSFTYQLENDCSIISDEFLVRTILENMIDNAVKFRTTSTRINPFVKINLKKEGSYVKIRVEDNGIGIGKEYSHDMFRMFIRASEQSEIGGVGLYLIKLAIDKAGGEIVLLESSSSGSIFQALLPVDINEVINERSKSERKLVEIFEKHS